MIHRFSQIIDIFAGIMLLISSIIIIDYINILDDYKSLKLKYDVLEYEYAELVVGKLNDAYSQIDSVVTKMERVK